MHERFYPCPGHSPPAIAAERVSNGRVQAHYTYE